MSRLRDEPGSTIGRANALDADLLQADTEVALAQFGPAVTDPLNLVETVQVRCLMLPRVPLDEVAEGIQFLGRARSVRACGSAGSRRSGGFRGLVDGDRKCHRTVRALEGFHADDTSRTCQTCLTRHETVTGVTDANLTPCNNGDSSLDKPAGGDTCDRFSELLLNALVTGDRLFGIDLPNARLCKKHQWWEISKLSPVGGLR